MPIETVLLFDKLKDDMSIANASAKAKLKMSEKAYDMSPEPLMP